VLLAEPCTPLRVVLGHRRLLWPPRSGLAEKAAEKAKQGHSESPRSHICCLQTAAGSDRCWMSLTEPVLKPRGRMGRGNGTAGRRQWAMEDLHGSFVL